MFSAIALAAACTLSAEVTNISDRIRQDRAVPPFVAGAIVRLVRINSPAARAGVRVGDVIQAVDDQLIQNVCGFDRAIAKHSCDEARLTIRRGNSTMELSVKLTPKLPPSRLDQQQACAINVPSACTALGVKHKQIDLFGLGCDLGDAEGCYFFAVNAGENSSRARDAYREACDFGNPLACTNLGWMLQFGHGGNIDVDESMRLYRKGCDGSPCDPPNNVGCVNLGRMLADRKAYRDSTPIFRQVCDRTPLNDEDAHVISRACSLAGTASMFGNGTPMNIAEAVKLLEKGCAADDSFGCFNLATIYDNGELVKEDRARAMGYYRNACVHGDGEACTRYAKLSGK
jgi:TPR repeat protein